MSDEWVDFKAIKDAVTMEMALAQYEIELRRVNAMSLRGRCPLPTHTGKGGNSFGVNTSKNAWACHAGACVRARDGRTGGNVLDFVAVMEECSIRDAALSLQNWFSVAASNERPSDYVPSRQRKREEKGELVAGKTKGGDTAAADVPGDDAETQPDNQPLGYALKSVDSKHPYLRRRGIKQETAEHFGVGYFFGKGMMAERVVFPIHNAQGELVANAGRAIDDEIEPRYKLPTDFRKSLVLFNLHRAIASEGRGVIVVEGYFDALKVHQAGFPNVVALMGSVMSEDQEQLLCEHVDHVVLMLDGDESGKAASDEISARLVRRMFVRVLTLPDGTQPDTMASADIQKHLSFFGGIQTNT